MAEQESVYLWSTTALTNGAVDDSINFAEGQLPGTLNNSNRSVMASVARWLKDTNGSISSGGSANAYTLTINGKQTAYATGQIYSFKANFSNTGAATLNITNADAAVIGAKAIRVFTVAGEAALSANMIRSSGHYVFQYDAAANAAAGAFILLNPTLDYAASTAVVSSLNGQVGALDIPSICGLRISLVTGTPVHGDVSSAATIYATPAHWAGNYVPLWNGTDLVPTFFGEVSQALSDTTKSPAAAVPNACYDIVAWSDGGTPRISRSDYWKKSSTVTMTIASPCVVTYAAHGMANGTPVVLTTTGALPTGLTAGTTYFTVGVATNTFNLAATVGGAAINTSGSQSGTHTATVGDDSGAVALGSGGNCEADLTTAGIYLNKNAITNGPSALRGTILGSIRTDSSGTVTWKRGGAAAGGDAALLSIYNIYNEVEVAAEVSDTTASWTQTSSTVGTLNPAVGSGLGNRISVLTRLTRHDMDVALCCRMSVNGAGVTLGTVGFAKNSLTAFDRQAQLVSNAVLVSSTVQPRKTYTGVLGWNYFQALQSSDGTNANTFVGTAAQQALILLTRA